MSEKDAYIEHLENTIKDLQNQVSNLTEMILLRRKDKFGSKSEKTPQVDGQLSLFNEAEIEARQEEEPLVERKGQIFHKNRKTTREELLKDLPVEEVPCIVHPDDMTCDQCGSALKEIGFVKVRDELEYVPAKVKIIRYMQQACECPHCKHKGIPFIRKSGYSKVCFEPFPCIPKFRCMCYVPQVYKRNPSLSSGKRLGADRDWSQPCYYG